MQHDLVEDRRPCLQFQDSQKVKTYNQIESVNSEITGDKDFRGPPCVHKHS